MNEPTRNSYRNKEYALDALVGFVAVALLVVLIYCAGHYSDQLLGRNDRHLSVLATFGRGVRAVAALLTALAIASIACDLCAIIGGRIIALVRKKRGA